MKVFLMKVVLIVKIKTKIIKLKKFRKAVISYMIRNTR